MSNVEKFKMSKIAEEKALIWAGLMVKLMSQLVDDLKSDDELKKVRAFDYLDALTDAHNIISKTIDESTRTGALITSGLIDDKNNKFTPQEGKSHNEKKCGIPDNEARSIISSFLSELLSEVSGRKNDNESCSDQKTTH